MNTVDPNARKLRQCGKVLVAGQKFGLKASHLAGGSCLPFDGLAADDPPHCRITSQTVGVVHVFIAAKASKDRLTELPCHAMPPVLAGPAVLEMIAGNVSQAKSIVKLPVGKQPSIRADLGTVKFQPQTAVEIDPQTGLSGFTRWVTRDAFVMM